MASSKRGLFGQSNELFNLFNNMEQRRLEQLIEMASAAKLGVGISLLTMGSEEDRKHNLEIAEKLKKLLVENESSFDMETFTDITNEIDKSLKGRIENIVVDEEDIKEQFSKLLEFDNIKSWIFKAIKAVPANNLDQDDTASLAAFKKMLSKQFSSQSQFDDVIKWLEKLKNNSTGIVKTVINDFFKDYMTVLYATVCKALEVFTKELKELESPSTPSFRW